MVSAAERNRVSRCVALVCAVLLGGCGNTGSSELSLVAPEGCSPTDPAVVYRLTELHVPTRAQADAGAVVGHDLDGVDDACDVPDYAGGVDNALVQLSAALALLDPESPSLQERMDEALWCTTDDLECAPQWVGVRVQECTRGVKVDVFRVTEDACEALGTAEASALGTDGELQAQFASLDLDRAFESTGADLLFGLEGARLSATITADGLSNAVLGGTVPIETFEEALQDFIPGYPDVPEAEPLRDLGDIDREPGGDCDGFSVGLTFSADVDVSGESCD